MNGSSSHHAPASAHKILPRNLDRLAVVYIRQSTQHQVVNNRESAELQYQLKRRAVDLGWADERVLVIDDDQGISGQSVENRPGLKMASDASRCELVTTAANDTSAWHDRTCE